MKNLAGDAERGEQGPDTVGDGEANPSIGHTVSCSDSQTLE